MIPDDVRRFVLTNVPSVPFLEALLFFRASNGASLSAAEVARALYVQPQIAAGLIEDLRLAGLVSLCGTTAGGFRYAPLDPALGRIVDRLAATYSDDLIAITNLIHQSGKAARSFADAFKIRKAKE